MNTTKQQVETTAKMYECRDVARTILGDRFKPSMAELEKAIRAVAKRDKCHNIVAGATVIKEARLEGMESLMLMAAIVEMVEPSNVLLSGAAPTVTGNSAPSHRVRSN